LSELINTERLFNGSHPVHHDFETIFAKKLVFLLVELLAPGQGILTISAASFRERLSISKSRSTCLKIGSLQLLRNSP
jgi:hypothetical protein